MNNKKRIMVVEDSLEMQEIYREIFEEKKEYQIDYFSDAESALTQIKKEKYDLVILDIIMEPVSGDLFFIHVRKTLNLEKLPILVVSVLSPNVLEHLREISDVTFMQKPIKKEALLDNVKTMVGV